MRCGPERGPNGPACLAVDKACSVTGPGVNVFPLLAMHRRTARRRGWRQARGARGANRRFQAQTGQRWPFNLARGPAESLIKPRAVKTEQTAKTMPETDTQSLSLSLALSLSHSHLTVSFSFFPSFLFIFWPEKRQEKRNTRASLAQLG